jgi:hypothetical protein
VLRADGSAATLERRYEILIERGALRLISGVRRQGIWAVRYSGSPASRPIELCTAWRIPERVTTCERFAVDTLPEGPLLTFGGRYWRLGPPIDSGTTRSRRGGRSRRPT